jgi:hypothetical protein
VVVKPVSADSLRKTGIFEERAGDFWRFPPQERRTDTSETKSNARKAGISGLFSRFWGSLTERRTGWLTTEGSNSHIPEQEKPFEMSREFPAFSLLFGGGDFCSRELRVPDTHPSRKRRLTEGLHTPASPPAEPFPCRPLRWVSAKVCSSPNSGHWRANSECPLRAIRRSDQNHTRSGGNNCSQVGATSDDIGTPSV